MPQAPSYYDWSGRPTTGVTQAPNYAPLSNAPNAGDLAKGFQDLGNSFGDIALKEREDELRTNLAAADTMNADAQRKLLNDPASGFFNLRGEDAMNGYDAVKQQLIDLYDRNGQAFRDDPAARADYEHIKSIRLQSALSALDAHVVQERDRWMDGTAQARLQSAADDAVANYTDPRMVSTSLAIGRGEIMDMGERKGWSPDETEAAIRAFESGTRRSIISRMATAAPDAAAHYFNAVRDGLTTEDAAAADAALKIAKGEARRKEEEALRTTQNNLLKKMAAGHLTVDDIISSNLKPFGAGSKAQFLDMARAGAGGAPADDAETYASLYDRIHLPDGDPMRITDENALNTYVGRGLSYDGLNQLRGEIQRGRTPDGRIEEELKKGVMDVAKAALAEPDGLTGLADPGGAAQLLKFKIYFDEAYRAGRAEGKTPLQLTSPDSPDYIGKAIPRFQRSLSDIMQAGVARLRGAGAQGRYATPGDVKTDYDAGAITRDEASRILREKFGYQ